MIVIKHLGEGGSYGIGLNHISHKAQSQNDKHRKQPCQKPAEPPLKGRLDIVHRAACNLSVHLGLVLLSKNRLRIDGSHAKESADPHPENSPWAAADEGRGRSGQISCAYLGRDSRSQGLKRRHLAFFMLFALQTEISKNQTAALSEPPYLYKSETDCVVDACSHQNHNQQKTHQKVRSLFYPCLQ